MSRDIPNEMIIQSVGFGPELTARKALDRAREFLMGLEAVSPWHRPFDVSGMVAKHSNMAISEDLSDFETVSMTALADADNVKYFNVNDLENFDLDIDSKSYFGFRLSFSDLIQRRTRRDRVAINIKTQGMEAIENSKLPLHTELTSINVPSFRVGEANEIWGNLGTVISVLEYIINFSNPVHCCVYGSIQDSKIPWNIDRGNYALGWITYTRNPHFIEALSVDRRVTSFQNGVLLTIGDDVEAIEDDSKLAEISKIRALLKSAGVKDWREM